MDAAPASADAEKIIFEAVVKPHRSLSGRTMALVVCAMAAVSLFVTSLMLRLGAWPVIGFNTADLILAAFLLWLNTRAAAAREIIRLSETSLKVTRTNLHGQSEEFSLPPYWLNVTLEERAGTVPKLLLTTHNIHLEVAQQLGEAPKRDLAAALTRALHRSRNPRFDNPQLR